MTTIGWETLFTQSEFAWKNCWSLTAPPRLQTLTQLKQFLDLIHIKYYLVKPFCEVSPYPVVETRELLPSFDSDPWEYADLPGFSLVAFARPINYFTEIFQFELLSCPATAPRADIAQARMAKSLQIMLSKLPRGMHAQFRNQFSKDDVTCLGTYPSLLPYLAKMDRGQVLGMHGTPQEMIFHLGGIYASFPSDLDTEVKRYGLRIGKFAMDDPDSYNKNRLLVLQHLMELYGYPIASERRTSAALFARRLHKMGEKFLIRTLGQSDRTLTTIWNDGTHRAYPMVEKIALVQVDPNATDLLAQLYDEGYLLDGKTGTVILQVKYKQHKFSPDNVRQERAISIEQQEVIHPLTGKRLAANIIRDTTNMFLLLNDIVRGEYTGRTVYKRYELIESTDTEEKRLKVLYAWLAKHQRRIIGYSDEFFAVIDKILDSYLLSPENYEQFTETNDLYQEVINKYSYIQQARKIRVLEDLHEQTQKGVRINYSAMLAETVDLLHSLKFEIVSYFDTLVASIIRIGESTLNNRYLLRTYIEKNDDQLTASGLEIKKNYRKLVTLIDEFKAIRKAHTELYSHETSLT